jgi:gamma-glutamylcyclotransferase (GGCT)/AIG2-like uncharacterized protein YtfP
MELIVRFFLRADTLMKTNIFIYGTLKRGQLHHDLLKGQEFLALARTAPSYRLYNSGHFPALVEDTCQGVGVQGEVWRVDDSLLQVLDDFEDVPRLFTRKPIRLEEFHQPVSAYFFMGQVSSLEECGARWPGK